MNKKIGYLRVSGIKQDAESQRGVILKHDAGVTEWFSETQTGAMDWNERKLGGIIQGMERGDTLVVSEISRIARTLLGVLEVAKKIAERGAVLKIANLNMTVDSSINSQAMVAIMGMVSEMERSILIQRTRAGLVNAREKAALEGRELGKRGASKSYKLDARRREIEGLLDKGLSKSAIARLCDVERNTLDAWIKRASR